MDDALDHRGYWAVSSDVGLLPAEPAHLDGGWLPDPIDRIDRIAGALAHTSSVGLESVLRDVPTAELPEAMSPAGQEAALRAYVFVATRCIHDKLFDEDGCLGRAVSQPLWHLSRASGRPAGLTYASYVLTNCETVPQSRSQPETLLILRTFSGTSDEAWFIAVHLAIESIGGEVVAAVADCGTALSEKGDDALVLPLESLADALEWARTVLQRITDGVEPDTFRRQVRPHLHGFANVQFPLRPTVSVSYVGETGAQSGMIQSLDCMLAIGHSEPMERALGRFRDCAPPPHQEFIEQTRDVGRQIAETARERPKVRAAYMLALKALFQFRDCHATIVEEYLLGGTKGTGGTSGHVWLRALRDDVHSAITSFSG